MGAQFKTDKASVDAAVTELLSKLTQVDIIDTEAIADAIWHVAVQFDVDQTAVEDAFAATNWNGGKALDFDAFMDKVEAGIARQLTLDGLQLADFIAPRTCLAIGAFKRRDTIAATVSMLCQAAPGPVYLDS